jgi:hypothetical protein
MFRSSLLVWKCWEAMVVRVHSAINLVAWNAIALAQLVSCRQLASFGSALQCNNVVEIHDGRFA